MIRCFSRFNQLQLAALAQRLPTWKVNGETHLHKRLEFKDFKQAWEFMNLVADVAEARNHHPEWYNVYNRVEITLRTHDFEGITQKDADLAEFIDKAEELVKLK